LRQKSDRIFQTKKFLGNFQKPIDILIILWYNNNVPRGEGNKDVPRKALLIVVKSVFGVCVSTLQGSKKFLKTFKKPLDKIEIVWYNNNTERDSKPPIK
jgi:hypothetical protein